MRVTQRSLLKLSILPLILVILSACVTTGDPTPTLRGAFVPTRVSPTSQPTETATLTPSEIPQATVTSTETPQPTSTPTATQTATLTATATLTPVPATETPTEAATSTATPTVIDPNVTPSDATPTVTTLPIVYGETVRGTITNDQPRVLYSFTGLPGDTINIRMVAPNGDLDPYLKLLDSNGVVLEENDDYNTSISRDSLIDNFILPGGETFTIMATRFDEERGIRQGDFELTLSTGTYVDPPVEDQVLPLEPGATVNGEITRDQHVIYYSFEGRAGDLVTIDMTSNTNLLDPVLMLIGPDGTRLIENDDVPARNLDSVITDFVLPADGTYQIAATRFEGAAGNTTGQYSLTLTFAGGERAVPTPEVTPIAIGTPVIPEIQEALTLGQPVTGAISAQSGQLIYTFQASAGQNVSFSANRLSGLIDPLLMIIAPDGRLIGYNDDTSAVNRNATVDNLTLLADGEYRVIVTRSRQRAASAVGEVEILISEGTGEAPAATILPVEMTAGTPVEIELPRPQSEAVASLSGTAGETIQLRLRRGGNLGISFAVIYPLTNEVFWQGSEETVNLVLPYDGFYSVVVYARRGQGRLTISYMNP